MPIFFKAHRFPNFTPCSLFSMLLQGKEFAKPMFISTNTLFERILTTQTSVFKLDTWTKLTYYIDKVQRIAQYSALYC